MNSIMIILIQLWHSMLALVWENIGLRMYHATSDLLWISVGAKIPLYPRNLSLSMLVLTLLYLSLLINLLRRILMLKLTTYLVRTLSCHILNTTNGKGLA